MTRSNRKMILLLLATIWLVDYSSGINNTEVVDVVKQAGDWNSDGEGHIESVETADVVIKPQGDWKSEVEELIAQFHSTLPPHELARTICSHLYSHYPDLTWVVLIYDDITGGDAHQMRYYPENTHILFRFYGYNFVVTRYAGDPITTAYSLELDLLASFTPYCRLYCHDPACWNKYYHIDCAVTCENTFEKLLKLNYVEMFHVIQSRFTIYNFVGRKYSDTGRVDSGPISGSCQWDRRVVQRSIQMTPSCDNQSVVMMLLGTSKY